MLHITEESEILTTSVSLITKLREGLYASMQ